MKNSLKIAIIGAMEHEIEKIKNIMSDVSNFSAPNSEGYLGKISDFSVVISKSGEGKVNAAMNTQFIIDNFKPDFIINTGIAGGIAPDLSIGDIVIGDKLVQYDFDVTALGYARGYLCTGINPEEPTYLYSDEKLIEQFRQAISMFTEENKIRIGTIATGDCFVSDNSKKKKIYSEFNALACEMEGAAIAQTATYNKIPFVIIRAISDLADSEAKISLDKFELEIANLCAKTIAQMLEKINYRAGNI